MKKLITFAFVFLAFIAMPRAAAADDYACDLSVSGYFSGSGGGEYSALDDPEAIGICQNAVNNWAIQLCSGQGDTGVFYINYDVWYLGPWAPGWAGGASVPWRCDDGWPVYA